MQFNQQDLATRKAQARAQAQAARVRAQAGVPAGAPAAMLGRLLRAEAGRVLAGYLPMRSEADPIPAMMAHQGPVCVPVVEVRATPLRFRTWTPGAALQPGPLGTHVPATGAWCTPEVMIVPLLAFDARGHRLGYGGGYYDRTLAQLRQQRGRVLAIGFGFAAQELPAVPAGPTDARLDFIVTEAGILHIR